MTEKPAKSSKTVVKAATSAKPATAAKSSKTVVKAATSAKPAKAAKAADRVAVSRVRATRSRKPGHDKIAERAYFIHLEHGGGDEVGNWLRAEGELMAA